VLFESAIKVGAVVLRAAIERYGKHKGGNAKLPAGLLAALDMWKPEAKAWTTLAEIVAFLKPLEKLHGALTVVRCVVVGGEHFVSCSL
jgi:hypothetical protein